MAVCCLSKIVSSFIHSPSKLSGSKCLLARTLTIASNKRTRENDHQYGSTQNQQSTQETDTPGSSKSEGDEQEYEHIVRQRILQASLPHVHEYGWTKKALETGARDEGLPPVAHGMFPRGGAELIHFFYAKSNSELAQSLRLEIETAELQGLERPRGKPFIRKALETRLRLIVPYLDTWPQAMAILAMPQNITEAFSNLLKLSDNIWFYAGDRSVDFNWYTKRLSLAGVYKATEIYMIQDKSPDLDKTWAFLNNRLGDLQKFGAAKKSCEQTGDVLKEALVGFSIMGMNILGLTRNR